MDNNQVTVKSAANFYPGAWVEIDRGNTKDYRQIKAVTGVVLTLSGPAMAAGDFAPQLAAPNDITFIATTEFRMVVTYDGRTEQYSGLTFENIPGRYYVDQINKVSSLIQVSAMAGPPAGQPFMFPSGADGLQITLPNNGVDGTAAPGDADYIGQDNGPGLRTGIQALVDIDSISIVAVPESRPRQCRMRSSLIVKACIIALPFSIPRPSQSTRLCQPILQAFRRNATSTTQSMRQSTIRAL